MLKESILTALETAIGVNERNKDGWTALRHLKETQETWIKSDTASYRRDEIMRLLVKAGAKEE